MEDRPKPAQNVLIVNLLFPLEYGLFLVLSLLDLFLSLVIFHLGAYETNPAADYFLREFGRGWFVAYKIALVLIVIGLSEYVGRRRRLAARLLLWFAIALGTVVLLIHGNNFYMIQTQGG